MSALSFSLRIGARTQLRFKPSGVASSWLCFSCRRRLFSSDAIQENDIVLLRRVDSLGTNPVLSRPLKPGKTVELPKDHIPHERIIDKHFRDVVKSRRGREFRVFQPTLGEYTDLTPRLVTPIYSQDANAILALIDLHPTTPGPVNATDTERLEVFEAGTGHGALTLHLARAIHAANLTPPTIPDDQYAPSPNDGDGSAVMSKSTVVGGSEQEAYQIWRANRRAVIHTLDSSPQHSAHAKTVVKNFRHGMYFPSVDFHVGSVNEYISRRLADNGGEPFLDHVILDLPGCDDYLEIASAGLKPNGSLLVFCPSITQINSCFLDTVHNGLPLLFEAVVELGAGGGTGGREWDVRRVRPRAFLRAQAEAAKGDRSESDGATAADGTAVDIDSQGRAGKPRPDGWELICRPKVGRRVCGGGFVGQWRKMRLEQDPPLEKQEVDRATEEEIPVET